MDTATRSGADPFLAAFQAFEEERGRDPVHGLRKEAMARFLDLGIPTTKVEAWRLPNVAPPLRRPFRLARPDGGGPGGARIRDAARHLLGPGLVFVDGHYRADLSAPPRGATVRSLAAALRDGDDGALGRLGRIVAHGERPFAALNAAFLEDGAFVRLGRASRPEGPVYLHFLSTGGSMSHPRNLLVLEEGAEAQVVEVYAGLGGDGGFTNTVTEILLERNAALDHTRLQIEDPRTVHVATLAAHQARDSRFTSHNVALGAALARTDLTAALDGEGCAAVLNGLLLAGDAQHLDNHTWIEHRKPHGESHELYKSILDGEAKGVFSGTIHVFPDAQKTDAYQASASLLLSGTAMIDSQPQLEIYADDVKCSHGSTVGQIDADALFYLRSRGVPEAQARNVLVHAFAGEVTDRLAVPAVREKVEGLLAARLPGGAIRR
jgi:Fe-S cluster assembly protein SufD